MIPDFPVNCKSHFLSRGSRTREIYTYHHTCASISSPPCMGRIGRARPVDAPSVGAEEKEKSTHEEEVIGEDKWGNTQYWFFPSTDSY